MASLLECRTASEVIDNYRTVRARMRALKSPEPPPAPEPIPEPEPVIRHIEITEMPQDTSITVHRQEAEPVAVRTHPSVYRIVGAVCEKYKVSRAELSSSRRPAYIVRPRQIAMYLARNLTLLSLPQIGRALGGKDHTTCLFGVRKITKLRAIFRDLDKELTELESILGGNNVVE